MIKSKIFTICRGIGYKEEEESFNLFLENLQNSEDFQCIFQIFVRANSILILYKTKENSNGANESYSICNNCCKYPLSSCEIVSVDSANLDYTYVMNPEV